MNLKILCVFLLFFYGFVLYAQDLGCEKNLTYKQDVALDVENKTLTGHEIILWKNSGSIPVTELYFHLYLNAFKNSQSTFLKELSKTSELHYLLKSPKKTSWGYCQINAITVVSDGLFEKSDISGSLQYVQPDDNNKEDETVVKVSLPHPLPPGKVMEIEIDFITKCPSGFPRSGFKGNYFFAGQWYPKLGVWENNEWNCHQYHLSSEFFADYGDFDVKITIPEKYVIGATGTLLDSTKHENGAVTFHFFQECVHDFVWTAYSNYRIAFRLFEHPDLPPVKMRLLYQPEHKKYVDDYFDATENTLKHLGLWYMPYPYSQITIIDPVSGSRTGGMEYPTLFTSGVEWLTAKGSQSPKGLTVHECSHQFFYGLLGSNEFEHAWLDEGFTTYVTSRIMDVAYGSGSFSKVYLERDGFGIPFTFSRIEEESRDWIVAEHRKKGGKDKMDDFAWKFVDYSSYRDNAYEKPALMLWTLENYIGTELFTNIVKTYVQRFAFKHPKPQDFINIVNELAPENMDWFFEQMLNDSGSLDYEVTKVVSNPIAEKSGYFGSGENLKLIEPQKTKDEHFLSQVHIKRSGTLKIPVDIVVTFENGESIEEKWDGNEKYKIFLYDSNSKIDKVEIDPFRKIFLDTHPANNGRYREASSFVSFRWGAKWMLWLQHLLEVAAIFS